MTDTDTDTDTKAKKRRPTRRRKSQQGEPEAPRVWPDYDPPWAEGPEVKRLREKIVALGFPPDLDDLLDYRSEIRTSGGDIPMCVISYIEEMKAEKRARRRRPRFEPDSARSTLRLLGRLMGHCEATVDALTTEVFETSAIKDQIAEVEAGARMALAAARLADGIWRLSGPAHREATWQEPPVAQPEESA